MYTITSDLTAEQYAKKYDLSVNRESDETLNFLIYKGEIPYLYQCVNFTGFRKYAKIQPIELTIEIDALGFSHLTGHTFPEEMPEKYFPRLEQLVAAFPLWYVHDAQFHTIQLSLGVKD
jgi:hypothetical protein